MTAPPHRGEVTVWTARCPAPGPVVDRLAQSLPPAEQARAGALHGPRRAEFVTGRVLLRDHLARRLRCAPRDVPLLVTATGRPEVPGRAGGLVLAAFSRDGAVGVDIEPDSRPPSALAWTCSAGERAWLASLPEPHRSRAFARLWTRKEACVKAAGTGIHTHLKGIHCGPGRAGPGGGRTSGGPDAVTHERCGRDPDAIGEAALVEPARTPLVGAPGQVYSYSNLGFTVAGHVAETRAHQAFHDLFRERVAEPLGMTRTTHDPAVAMTYPLLQHHVDRDGGLRVAHAPWVAAKHAPSSQCWSTVEDMARFGAMHMAGGRCAAGRLVGPRLLGELHRPHVDVRLDIDLRYGLGFYIGPRDPAATRFGHEGFYDGMWCKLICVPAAGIGLVWADNRGDELRDPRYRAIDTILAALGAGDATSGLIGGLLNAAAQIGTAVGIAVLVVTAQWSSTAAGFLLAATIALAAAATAALPATVQVPPAR